MKKPKPSGLPESYLVRIYRRDPAGPDTAAGIVERVDTATPPRPFQSQEELLALLGIKTDDEH